MDITQIEYLYISEQKVHQCFLIYSWFPPIYFVHCNKICYFSLANSFFFIVSICTSSQKLLHYASSFVYLLWALLIYIPNKSTSWKTFAHNCSITFLVQGTFTVSIMNKVLPQFVWHCVIVHVTCLKKMYFNIVYMYYFSNLHNNKSVSVFNFAQSHSAWVTVVLFVLLREELQRDKIFV